MLIYKINFSFIFLTYLYFWWAWPKGACRMQTDRSTNKQTDRQTKSRTYAKNWRTDDLSRLRQRIGEQTNRRSLSPTPRIGEHGLVFD